jgi:hypothetical protein
MPNDTLPTGSDPVLIARGPTSGDFAIGDDHTAAAPTQPIPTFEVAGDGADGVEVLELREIAARWPRLGATDDLATLEQLAPNRRHTARLPGGGAITVTRIAPADLVDDDDFAAPEGGGGFDVSDAPTAAQVAGAAAHAQQLGEWSRWFDGVTGEMDAARELVPAVLAQVEDLEPRSRIWALLDALISELNDAPPEIGRDLAFDAVTIIRQRGPK